MSVWKKITRFAQDPPPAHIFEMSEGGVAYSIQGQTGFRRFEPGTLVPSPLRDNLIGAQDAADAIGEIAPLNGGKKRRPATVILPDHAARVSLLDFDSFPSAAAEQLALVRFRVKKTIPFDIDSAAVSYWVQPGTGPNHKIDVVAVTVALEVLARYEALFRNAGFQPGQVTTSAIAALELFNGSGVTVIAKLAGAVLTVIGVADGRLELFRCLEIADAHTAHVHTEHINDELMEVLQPTFVFIQDELGRPVDKLVVCGVAPEGQQAMSDHLRVPVEPLRSRLGAPGPYNAGLLGYLEGVVL